MHSTANIYYFYLDPPAFPVLPPLADDAWLLWGEDPEELLLPLLLYRRFTKMLLLCCCCCCSVLLSLV